MNDKSIQGVLKHVLTHYEFVFNQTIASFAINISDELLIRDFYKISLKEVLF